MAESLQLPMVTGSQTAELANIENFTSRAATGFDRMSDSATVFLNVMYHVDQTFSYTNVSMQQLNSTVVDIDQTMVDLASSETSAAAAGTNLGNSMKETEEKAKKAAKQLSSVLKLAKSFGSKTFAFGKEAFKLSNQQQNAETQIKTILARTGAAEGAFDSLKSKASEIQMKTIYKDDVLMAGAGKMAAHTKDPLIMEQMMGTMADYAAGMSGGGAVDTKTMSEYGQQLGKALGGDYESLDKLGLLLTETQKELIKNGTEQDKALAISEAVGQSWGGLAEAMAGLPENRLVGITNSINEMKASVGAQITPVLMNLFDVIETHMPTIQSAMTGFGLVLGRVIEIVALLADAAGNAVGFIVDNWSMFEPVVVGLGLALLGLLIYQLALNAAMLANPITLIILAVIALVAIIYGLVESFNELNGTSYSAFGIIAGGLAAVGAVVWNVFLGLIDLVGGVISYWVNGFVAFANFFGNILNNPVSSVIHLVADMADRVLGILESIAMAIDKVFNTGLSSAVSSWRSNVKGMAVDLVAKMAPDEDYQTYIDEFELNADTFGLERLDYKDTFDSAYDWGENFKNPLEGMGGSGLDDLIAGSGGSSFAPETYGSGGNPATVKGTGAGGAVKVENDEDISWMRQLAERDYIARINQNTLAPNIRVEFSGPITKETDTDSVLGHLNQELQAMIATAPEGVYV